MATDVASGGVIERAGLSSRILAALRGGSLLVVADAGFGKTTALRQALAKSELDVAWVGCGAAAGDAGRLLGLIVDAVRGALPGAVDALAEQLSASREPIDPERAATALERELADVLVDPLIVVFDDAEALDGATAALGVVARLLSADTPLLRVALATRRQPALRLARARAAGRLHELGPADLAFSTADCAQYLRLSGGAEPDESEVEAVLSATEGWPLGVVLAAGSHGRGRTAPSRRLVHSYFEEEVLANLEPELRRALLRAAIAPDLEIARAAGVGLHPEFGDAVDRRGLFVRGEGGVGRPEFHPLFREFLRSRGADEIQTAEQRAVAAGIAAALVSQGRGAESVDYYLAAEEWDAAATAVACEGATLVRTAPETVGSWLAAMPATHISRPELTLLAGQLAHGEGRFDDAVELCQVAVERFERNGASSPQRFAALLALGDALMASGDLAGAASLGHVLDDPDAAGI
jgi:LuxR family maltose regulon positive regulatory protein